MTQKNSDLSLHRLISDAQVAELLSVSRSWVRKERFNRRHGLPYVFDVDAVMVGSLPRYQINDVRAWIASRKPANDNIKSACQEEVGHE